jgi:hypothetical protein
VPGEGIATKPCEDFAGGLSLRQDEATPLFDDQPAHTLFGT